jgi:RimJ/RimL family protein N-acetyltransferase
LSLPTLLTPRLALRAVEDDDAEALLALFGDAERMRFWGHAPLASTEDAAAYVESIREGAARGDLLQWVIAPRSDGEGAGRLLGTCTLAAVDAHHRRAGLGVALLPEAEGAGFAAEAAGAAIRYAFEDLDLHRVTADADPRNAAALALLERVGFRREGVLREHYRSGDEWQDGVMYGRLRGEG